MPIHEFKCNKGHVSERLFLTFKAAEQTPIICCLHKEDGVFCAKMAHRIVSIPGQAILYGEGFYKPAASGNRNYKRSDPSKAAKDFSKETGAGNVANLMKKTR